MQTIDLDRLRHLSALGDTQAAAELQRQESRRGDALPALLSQLRAAFDQGDFNTARVKVFGLHCAGYDQLRWRICYLLRPPTPTHTYIGETDTDLITGKHAQRDHFKVCSSGGGGMGIMGYDEDLTLTTRRVAFPHRNGLASIPIFWNQAILDMARAELARYAQHWGRLLVASPQWAEFVGQHPTNAWLGPIGYIISSGWPSMFGPQPDLAPLARRLPDSGTLRHRTPPSPGAIAAVILDALDPTATLSQLRANATAARIYTRHALDGITEGEGRAARQDMARMLAALYCGCDYRITPEAT